MHRHVGVGHAENDVDVFRRQLRLIHRLSPVTPVFALIFLAKPSRCAGVGLYTFALSILRISHKPGKRRPSLLPGTIDPDPPRVLAREQIQARQTRRRRAQIRHAGKIPRPMRHHAQQRSAVGIIDQRQLGLIGIERRPFLLCCPRSPCGAAPPARQRRRNDAEPPA